MSGPGEALAWLSVTVTLFGLWGVRDCRRKSVAIGDPDLLALKTHNRLLLWPASTFLPRNGHLIRRIHMLKDQFQPRNGSITLAGRAVTIAVLVAVGLRSSPRVDAAETPAATETKPSKTATPLQTRPFDLSYIPTKTTGFGAVRPAAIFDRADMKEMFAALNAMIAKAVPDVMPRLESIEQATVGITVTPRDRTKGRPGTLMLGGLMVRSVNDFDWKSLVRALVKRFGTADSDFVEVRFGGQTYYKATKVPDLGPNPCFFYFPDARTAVTLDEEQIRRLITRGAGDRPENVRGDDWQQVESGLIAVALDSHVQSWILDEATAEPDELRFAQLLKNATRWVCGVEGADTLHIRAVATCDTDIKGQLLASTVDSLLAMARTVVDQTKPDVPKGKEEVAAKLIRLYKDALQACKVRREGSVVDVSVESHLGLDWLVKLFVGQEGL